MPATFRPINLLVVLFSVVILSGCAFGTRHPTLTYPPEEDSSTIGTAHAAPSIPTHADTILLQTFTDQRSDKETVGTVRNGLGMRTADVIPTNDVSEWVTDAVRTELQNNGYTVVKEGKLADAGNNYVVVTGEILKVFCDMYFNYSGQVSLIVKAEKEGEEMVNKEYSGEGSAGLVWGATEKSFAQSLALALSSAINKFIEDFDQHTK